MMMMMMMVPLMMMMVPLMVMVMVMVMADAQVVQNIPDRRIVRDLQKSQGVGYRLEKLFERAGIHDPTDITGGDAGLFNALN
jgi:hypothetical protein